MKDHHLYGRDEDGVTFPPVEGFRFRAHRLDCAIRLCEFCLRTCPRCMDSARWRPRERSWKRYRRTQYRSADPPS